MDFRFYLVTDGHAGLVERVDAACAAGIRAVQLREKDLAADDLYALATALRSVTRRHGARLFVNDRLDVALAAGADGVHLREDSLPPSAVRGVAPALPAGASVHSTEAAVRAAEDGARFVVFGPVFATPSKRSFGPPQGLQALRTVAQAVACPVFAIGGLTPQRVAACLDAGAHGVAAISSIMQAADVEAAVHAYERCGVIP